jgi:ABC-2 type transport system permease protein
LRTALTLARYQLFILLRTPGYWAAALVLSTLGIIVFGLFLTDPTGPRLGIVDEAGNDASARLIAAAEDLDRVNVRIGNREEQIDKLHDGERWAVIVLPTGFGSDSSASGVEVWTGDPQSSATFVGSGIIRQLLVDAVGGEGPYGIEVVEEPVSGDDPLRFIDVVVPGQVGLSLMFGNLFAATMLGWWRQQGILKRIAASPARPAHLLASQLLVFGLVSAMQATILLLIGSLLFGVAIKGSVLALAATVLAGVLVFLTLWYTLIAFIRSPIFATSLASLLGFVMMFAGGSYLVIEDPPLFLKPVVVAAPLGYLNDALRDVINHGEGFRSISTDLGILAAWIAVLFVVSMRIFRWTTDD